MGVEDVVLAGAVAGTDEELLLGGGFADVLPGGASSEEESVPDEDDGGDGRGLVAGVLAGAGVLAFGMSLGAVGVAEMGVLGGAFCTGFFLGASSSVLLLSLESVEEAFCLLVDTLLLMGTGVTAAGVFLMLLPGFDTVVQGALVEVDTRLSSASFPFFSFLFFRLSFGLSFSAVSVDSLTGLFSCFLFFFFFLHCTLTPFSADSSSSTSLPLFLAFPLTPTEGLASRLSTFTLMLSLSRTT